MGTLRKNYSPFPYHELGRSNFVWNFCDHLLDCTTTHLRTQRLHNLLSQGHENLKPRKVKSGREEETGKRGYIARSFIIYTLHFDIFMERHAKHILPLPSHLLASLLLCWYSILKMEMIRCSETLVHIQTTRSYISENGSSPRARLDEYSKSKVKVNLPRNRPWRPIGLWDVKDPTLSRQSAHS
jgi:hypothetical protein